MEDQSFMILFFLLLANIIISFIFLIYKRIHHEGAGMVIFFIFLPGLGFLFYFIPTLFKSFLKSVGVDREAVLTHAFEMERVPEHPDVSEELDVVPVEDALAVGGNAEKRNLLINQLKKDLNDNYKIILAAEGDEDSESAHYAAAAKMEVYRIAQARWLECRRDYEKYPENPVKFHLACDAVRDVLTSGVFSSREMNAFRKRLCRLIERQITINENEISQIELEDFLRAFADLDKPRDAERVWNKYKDKLMSENTYHIMLKMYYDEGNRQKFEEILADLRKNRQIRLSTDGLERLRYWTRRLNHSRNKDA